MPDQTQYREMTVAVERDALETRAAGDERIPIAISSEAPYERMDYLTGERFLEVLDHGAIDLTMGRDGLPFLLEHRSGVQLGLVEEISIGPDKRMRGVVRFSKSRQAQEIKQDMIDGIRRKVSVGYRLSDDYDQRDGEGEGALPTRRFKNWKPMEASSVSIPADYEVGVGRSAGEAARPVSPPPLASSAREAKEHTVSVENAAGQNGSAPTDARVSAPAPDTRVADILAIASAHKRPLDWAAAQIASGKSANDVAGEVLRDYQTGAAKAASLTPGASLKLTEKEEASYSVVRAINSLAQGKREGFEFEVSDQLAKDRGKPTQGVLVPTSMRAEMPGAIPLQTRTQLSIAAGAGKGTEAKFTEFNSFIDLLRNRLTAVQLGAQMLPGLQGDIGFVDQTAAGTASFTTEIAANTLSSLTTALRTMSPKNLQSSSSYSRQLLAQSVVSVENLVRDDIAKLHAIAIDLAVINGSGAANNPRGILNTVGIGSVAIGANGGAPTYEHMVDLQKEVAIDNAMFGSLAYLTEPKAAAKLLKTQKFSSTSGEAVWTGNMLDGSIAGFKATASNQVPSTLTKGASGAVCSAIIFGQFDQVLIGEWGAMELIVDPYTVGPTLVKLMSLQMVDVFVRYVTAFSAVVDATTT